MDTKLTLIIEQDVIVQAKNYARSKGRSLSDLVENYLKTLSTGNKPIANEAPIVKALKGSLKVPADFDYKTELGRTLSKKYLK